MQMTTSYFGHAHGAHGAQAPLQFIAQGPLQFLAQARVLYRDQAPVPFNAEAADSFDPEATLPVNVTFLDPKSVTGRPSQAQSPVRTIGLLEPAIPTKAHIPPSVPDVVPLPPTPHPEPLTSTPTDVPPEVIEPPMPGEHVPVVDPALPGQTVIVSV